MRDEIKVVPRPYEGVRRSLAPRVRTDDGIVDGDTIPFVYLKDRAVPTQMYKLMFTSELAFETVDTYPKGPTWLWVPGGALWLQNGEMNFEPGYAFGTEPQAHLPAGVDLQIIGGELQYLAPLA